MLIRHQFTCVTYFELLYLHVQLNRAPKITTSLVGDNVNINILVKVHWWLLIDIITHTCIKYASSIKTCESKGNYYQRPDFTAHFHAHNRVGVSRANSNFQRYSVRPWMLHPILLNCRCRVITSTEAMLEFLFCFDLHREGTFEGMHITKFRTRMWDTKLKVTVFRLHYMLIIASKIHAILSKPKRGAR